MICINDVGHPDSLFSLSTAAGRGDAIPLRPPLLEIDGVAVSAAFRPAGPTTERVLPSGVVETVYEGQLLSDEAVSLSLTIRHRPGSSFLRFRMSLCSREPRRLTAQGAQTLTYFEAPIASAANVHEISLGQFDTALHSYTLVETPIQPEALSADIRFAGPLLCAESGGQTLLLGYEHGSTVPDAFMAFHLRQEGTATTTARLQAVKGNFPSGLDLSREEFSSIWFQVGLIAGGLDACSEAYRTFILQDQSENRATRKPYIFYNTWNFQERNKHWNGRTYLASMQQERIAREIEIAHRMGIEVFVLDTGWYARTGEWAVNAESFDADLRTIRAMLDTHGMKLGLWFGPGQAAVSTDVAADFHDCRRTINGVPVEPVPIWETEESDSLCLVSRYGEAFADELIRLHKELGVTYFKWDAIHQYGCDAPNHNHGTPDHSRQEREDCYAYEQVRSMSRIVDRICCACPDAIVDFDITEPERSVGLAFLASGKFFLINNGPYYRDLDDPVPAPGGGMGTNVLVFPGPARARNCRATLDFDRWIPSILFLAHALPDSPLSSQETNLASLILGHNGIWGDLCSLDAESISFFGHWLDCYKQVREDVTSASPVRVGKVGGCPEVHEKINPDTGRGVVCLFATRPGRYQYVTRHTVSASCATMPGMQVNLLPSSHARITVTMEQAGGKAGFFGASMAPDGLDLVER